MNKIIKQKKSRNLEYQTLPENFLPAKSTYSPEIKSL